MVYEHDTPPQMVDVGQLAPVGNGCSAIVISRQLAIISVAGAPAHLDR